MKRISSILLVVLVFGTVSLLAAQENQATASPTAAPAVASPANAATGVVTEPSATSGDKELVTTPPPATKSAEQGRADSENKPAFEGNPDPAQNVIEYGGPG